DDIHIETAGAGFGQRAMADIAGAAFPDLDLQAVSLLEAGEDLAHILDGGRRVELQAALFPGAVEQAGETVRPSQRERVRCAFGRRGWSRQANLRGQQKESQQRRSRMPSTAGHWLSSYSDGGTRGCRHLDHALEILRSKLADRILVEQVAHLRCDAAL